MRTKKIFFNNKFILPTFLKGFTSVFDITGQFMLDIPDLNKGFQRDAEALKNDWYRIGGDIKKSMDCLAHE